jgi:hypothetical protein
MNRLKTEINNGTKKRKREKTGKKALEEKK